MCGFPPFGGAASQRLDYRPEEQVQTNQAAEAPSGFMNGENATSVELEI